MADAGAFVVVDGQTYRVLGRLHDDVLAAVQEALSQGSTLALDVVPEPSRGGEHPGQGTLLVRGDRVAAIAVLTGPLPATGHPIGF
jgi:hypothetical protein